MTCKNHMNQDINSSTPYILNVGFATHNADWNWKNVNSPFARLYYVTEGNAQVEFLDGIHDLNAGHMYFIPAYTKHNNICKSHFSHYYLHIYDDNINEGCGLSQWKFPFEIDAGQLELALFERLCQINPRIKLPESNPASYDNNNTLVKTLAFNGQQTLCCKLETQGIMLQLLARFFKNATNVAENTDNRVAKALSHIREHIYEPIKLDAIASNLGISKDHFIKLFKKETGFTPTQYINLKKVERAQLMLATEDIPIKEVACKLSFYDYPYFHKLFKKATGLTPQAYRAQYIYDKNATAVP